jgi:hypothetical protein
MKNLEKHLTNLKLSRRLEELGVPQESEFYWHRIKDFNSKRYRNIINDSKKEIKLSYATQRYIEGTEEKVYSAFLSSEIGEMLFKAFEKYGWDLIYKSYGEVFDYKGTGIIGGLGIIRLMREPNMGAKMLIYLLENGLIKIIN